MPNPFLPLNEYIPDGEPHVFQDRIYLYGSHDQADGKRFCTQDYVVYSAAIDDLKNWECKGISYRKDQDPRSRKEKSVDLYAPDCVRGNDGRYYLYYFAAGPNTRPFGSMSVAVSDRPDGPFEYLHDICYENGEAVLDYLTNDPAVINDDGKIYLYYGWGLGRDFSDPLLKPLYDRVLNRLTNRTLKQIRECKPSILSCAVVELKEDMYTVRTGPKAVLDSKTTADRYSKLYHHAFYEAPSIRKIQDTYYLIYSSGENNELAYATSKYPDKNFEYRGVIISNSDLGYKGNRKAMNNAGTIHGSIEQINGQWYVFYHRCTNNTDFSRQACVEPITINPDGSIDQVEMTSLGFDDILKAEGEISAGYCCNLVTKNRIRLGTGRQQKLPRITQTDDRVVVKDLTAGTKVILKYFDFSLQVRMKIDMSGNALIRSNGSFPDEKGYYHLKGNGHDALEIEIVKGKTEIRSFRFFPEDSSFSKTI